MGPEPALIFPTEN